jgi:chromosome segregation ATPase
MEIVNAVLLILALTFVWGAVNLERPSASKVEINQTDQFNESVKFLQRLKKPSAKEDSYDRRINAYKSTMDSIISEIPDTVQQMEDSYDHNNKNATQKIGQLNSLVSSITTRLEGSNDAQQQTFLTAIEKLNQLSSQINNLKTTIIPIDEQLNQNQDLLNNLSADTEKVKQSVGF